MGCLGTTWANGTLITSDLVPHSISLTVINKDNAFTTVIFSRCGQQTTLGKGIAGEVPRMEEVSVIDALLHLIQSRLRMDEHWSMIVE